MTGRFFVFISLCIFVSGCGNSLVNSVAFHPQTFNDEDFTIQDARIEELFFSAKDGVALHAFYIPYPGQTKAILFLHGNAGHALHRIEDAWELAKTGVSVLLLSYRGYGKSGGEASEEGVYLDAEAALVYLEGRLGYKKENIYILGRSLGSAIGIDAAQHNHLGGLILVSPLTSGDEMIKHWQGASWLHWVVKNNPFDSISKLKNVKSPGLIIHGSEDKIIPLKMGLEIYDSYPVSKKEMHIIHGAEHNDLIQVSGSEYWNIIKAFISKS